MSLQNILSPLSAELGIKITNPTERAYLVDAINRAARELHSLNDLRGCEREQVFQLDLNSSQIALPRTVDKVFAVRHYESKLSIKLTDMQPRYANSTWQAYDVGLYKWRLKGISPLKKSILDDTKLTFSLPLPNASGFNVVIIGGTSNSAKVTEVVNFSATDLSKTTVNNFTSVEKLRVVGTRQYDLTVTDMDANEIAEICNNEDESVYQIVQIMDNNDYAVEDTVVEVLYKVKFVPVVDDYDSFVFGDIYDEVVYYLTMGRLLAKQQGQEERMQLAMANSQRLLVGIIANVESQTEKKFTFDETGVTRIFRDLTGGMKL